MQNKHLQPVRIATFAAATFVAAAVALDLRADPSTAPATSRATTRPAALTVGPIAYFEQNCARCHGAYGTFYGDTFGKGLTDATLHEFVRDMAEGPGNAPLEAGDLAAQTAYHRSLVRRAPFIAIVKSDATELSGNVTPGATVTLTSNGLTKRAVVTEFTFTIQLDTPLAPDAVIQAKLADQTTELKVSDQYNHQEKLK